MTDNKTLELEFYALTPDRWADFEALFGERGGTGGCWCMWWKLKRSEFDRQKGEGNRQAMKAIVDSGLAPGIVAYANGQPIGWCAVGLRQQYPVLNRSPNLKPVDETPAWSITCFFVDKHYRRQGVTQGLLQAAIDYVQEQGGRVVEGYPIEASKDEMPAVFAWTGFASTFEQAGFAEVARRSQTRPIMRYTIEDKATD